MACVRCAVLLFFAIHVLTCPVKSGDNRQAQKPVYKVGVDTVFLRVSVTDPMNRVVTGLTREDFRVFEDKVQQEICMFVQETSPASIGILLDISGSMKANNNILSARAALSRFMSAIQSGDEFFLVTFNQDATLVKNFTDDSGAILNESAMKHPSGRTAVWDAVYRGLETVRGAKNYRRALILITDGEDNSSRYTSSEVREFAKESDVQIYAIGEPGELDYGPGELESIVKLTGGRAFFPENMNSLDYYIDLINAELRNQYVLGYVPSRRVHDGKWRKIEVKLDVPRGLPKIAVRAREGYYSAKN